jgi:hypothetical protein
MTMPWNEHPWDGFWDWCSQPYWWCYRTFKDAYHRIRRMPYFLSKLWDYTKLLWNDYDFDYLCLLDLIELKTKRTREYLVEEGMVHVDEKTMKEVELLARRIKEDNYYEWMWDEMHKKWPFRWRDLMGQSTLSPKEQEERSWALMHHHKKSEAQMEAELDRLFMLIRKHIRVWWS